MLRARLGRSFLHLLVAFLTVLALPVALRAVSAQTSRNFRVTWTVEKTGPVNTEVAGRVTNEARVDVIDVYVTVEALDDKGKVLARGLTHVSPLIRPAGSEAFVAKVPVVPGIQTYRALVSSYRMGLGGASQAP